jgi:hypothetical protein
MNNQHPITPPFELVQQWINEGDGFTEGYFATQAARWGADQQLAKDAEWLDQHALDAPHLKITPVGEFLKEAMRPKPPSLKEQALIEFDSLLGDSKYEGAAIILRALEALPND